MQFSETNCHAMHKSKIHSVFTQDVVKNSITNLATIFKYLVTHTESLDTFGNCTLTCMHVFFDSLFILVTPHYY